MAGKFEIKKVYINEEKYPALLREIKEPPETLYYVGDLNLSNKICAAIVGSRRTTEYGRWAAGALARTIAVAGGVVVSGMAARIDTSAHWGAIDAAGDASAKDIRHIQQGSLPTIAVLGCGIDICFPKTNLKLRDKIAAGGLIVSEYPPGTNPTKYTFPRRNRIISGLSVATAVIQAPNSSGALITAEMAAEQGRNVYAVPGNINSEYNLGSNKLLRDGAMPLVVLEDMVTDLGLSNKKHILIEENFGEDEKVILKALAAAGEMTVDQLCAATGISPAEASGLVTILEMKGVLCSCLGKIFIAK